MTATGLGQPSIILFGDSITQQGFGVEQSVGWAGLLSAAYSRRADVWSRGFSGYNTRHALSEFDGVFEALPSTNILFATVFFGANDAVLKGEKQHVPFEEYGENIKTIIEKIRKRSDTCDNKSSSTASTPTPLILMTPPPVASAAWNAHCLEKVRILKN